mmetsp:Transcript_47224/g.142993  ORF Transcript_47224/g.142993 Transcript_47224/m.142993 type:complete len:163 (-) Transcript_47224:134-622(-)|eukprot:CAMPEP_0113554538 /NCGR_PEP_ID=MMETSP0015_2-20120614/16207_1 /TAXON_ID=2838 /ORGANISM="Odontella" /LENGTH=162 /DNA_ID=CAMNT_0000455695 /DNA_START=148 /DNA_END=636 /DNA_ORIENTATION=+ /assembly_acc=CAM_ASM_000160
MRTKQSQKVARRDLDEKLRLSTPDRGLLEDLAVACASDPSPDKTFQYAFALSKSRQESELRYAVTILDSLVKEGYEHQIDCMYGSATALYLLGEFKEARSQCEAILRSKPDSRTAAELHLASIDAVEEEEERRSKQIAIGGSAAVAVLGAAVAIGGMLLQKR